MRGLDSTHESLIGMADFISQHYRVLSEMSYDHDKDYSQPYVSITTWSNELTLHCHGDDAKEMMARLRRAIGGKWEKSGDYWFTLTQDMGAFTVQIQAERTAVCTRRVVGTRTVTKPAVEAKPERVEEEEIVEWDCGPILPKAAERI